MKLTLGAGALLGGLGWLLAAAAMMQQAPDAGAAIDGLGAASIGLALATTGALLLQRSLRA